MMIFSLLVPGLLCVAFVAFFGGTQRARRITVFGEPHIPHSLPGHYGAFCALCAIVPAILFLFIWFGLERQIVSSFFMREMRLALPQMSTEDFSTLTSNVKMMVETGMTARQSSTALEGFARRYIEIETIARNVAAIVIITLSGITATFAYFRINKVLPARRLVETFVRGALLTCSAIAIIITIGIGLSVVVEAFHFFRLVSPVDFFFGTHWSPQIALRADQAGSTGAFGAIPVFVGTLLITGLAMVLAIPVGLLCAIYLSEYAGDTLRSRARPLLEVLAGVPTVVYGFFTALVVAPWLKSLGNSWGLAVSAENALAVGLIMGIMIIPYISSLTADVLHAVPKSLRDGSLALGATQLETICFVVIPAALPGIVAAILLAVSRAIGETMIVVMAAGLTAKLSFNPLASVTTITVQIVTLLIGDQEFNNSKTLAAFALGLILFIFTLALNLVAIRVVRHYRKRYE